MMLTVCIPYLERRDQRFYDNLIVQLNYMAQGLPVTFMSLPNNGEKSIGEYRQQMLMAVETPYIVFIDADDKVHSHYFKLVFQGIEKGAKCIGMRGIITTDGKNAAQFEHSTRYTSWSDKIVKSGSGFQKMRQYYRPINHLNPVLTDIARQIGYQPLKFGEDLDYSMRLSQSGLLKQEDEHFIEQPIYYYLYRSKK